LKDGRLFGTDIFTDTASGTLILVYIGYLCHFHHLVVVILRPLTFAATVEIEIIDLGTARAFKLKLRFRRTSMWIFNQNQVKSVFIATVRTGFKTFFETNLFNFSHR
jgi:hypothetical protein